MEVRVRTCALLAGLLMISSVSSYIEELDDTFMQTKSDDDIWLIKFYTPWCTFCKHLDPVWRRVGSELRSVGSPVIVGKSDASVNTALAKEFRVRGYPAILILKKNIKYNYLGPRNAEGILEFADRLSGPLVRPLTSRQLFEHARSRHNLMFVYIGSTSPLKGNFWSAAEDLIVSTYFFSSTREALPPDVHVPHLPAVVVLKDGTLLTYDEDEDGDLKRWINRERFPNYQKIDSYILYAMGDTGKLVLLSVQEDASPSEESLRSRHLVHKLSEEHREDYRRLVYFGFMEDRSYIDGLVMGEVDVPSIIMLNLSTDSYFLPESAVETERHLLDFIDQVLQGSIQSQGGNGVLQRMKRLVYDARVMLAPIFSWSPWLGWTIVGAVLLFVVLLFVFCYKLFSPSGELGQQDETQRPRSRRLEDKKCD
ncbi:protein disulfide-isomerase TMX3-like [Synchiropus picturatus]